MMPVNDNAAANRFEQQLNGKIAFQEYGIRGKYLMVFHTEVPPEFEGQGIGTALTEFALEYAKTHHLTVVPLCPFVSAYMREHHIPYDAELLKRLQTD